MNERPVVFGAGMVGVLSGPLAAGRDPWVLILNSGLVYRVGPGRLAVELARSAGDVGYSALRFDLSGLGDSEARIPPLDSVASAIADTREAMDYLEKEYGQSRFLLLGLCSGAVHAHHIAATDPRVVGAVLMDGYIFPTLRSRLSEVMTRLRSPLRLARGVFRRLRRRVSASRPVPSAPMDEESFLPHWPPRDRAARDLGTLKERGVALLYVFTQEWDRYRYQGQMKAAFADIGYGGLMEERWMLGAEHLYLTRNERTELLALVGDWLRRRPWESGRG